MIGTFHDDNMNRTALTYIKLHVFESPKSQINSMHTLINGPKKMNNKIIIKYYKIKDETT